ncbi:MAG: exosortase O [Deltaproteobacteria bacterium]|nr:exosortase O [Deltaproteobacteria bacterium]
MRKAATDKILLFAPWILLFGPTIQWLSGMVTYVGALVVVLVAVFGMLLVAASRGATSSPKSLKARRLGACLGRWGHRWLATPLKPRPFPLFLVLGSVFAFVVLSRTLDVRTLAAFLLVVGTYGMVGLFVERSAFRQGLPILVLLAVVLPLGRHMEMFVGFAARSLTAETVERMLALGRISAVSAPSILFLESGTAYVDEPCSGLRSLWSGTIFFLGLSYIQRVRIDLRWVGLGVAHLGLLCFANVLRVLAIVLISIHAGLPKIAHLVHETLGIVGFMGASVATYFLARRFLRRAPERTPSRVPRPGVANRRVHPGFSFGLSLVILVGWAARGEPPPRSARRPVTIDVRFPTDEALELSPAERQFFARVGGTSAKKRKFELGAVSGTSIVVSSEVWSAHHPPEACLSAAGFRLDALSDVPVADGGFIRVASVDGGTKTAIYWFQSPSMTTGGLLSRIWAEWSRGEEQWALISILADGPLYQDDVGVRALFSFVHERVGAAWSDAPSEPVSRLTHE